MSKIDPLILAIREVATKVQPSSHVDTKSYLQALFDELQAYVGSCTYWDFSQIIGLSRSNVAHLIMKGKRPLTRKAAEKIAAAIDLSGKEKRYLLELADYQHRSKVQEKVAALENLSKIKSKTIDDAEIRMQMQFYSAWYHMAIFEMAHMDGFNSDPDWICKTIVPNIRPDQARESIELLESLGLIRFDSAKGRHLPTQIDFDAAKVIAHLAITQYHNRMIDLAKVALADVEPSLRDISAVTIAIDHGDIPTLKKEIATFRLKLMEYSQKPTTRDVVYQINFQVFPLSKHIISRKKDDETNS